MTQTDHLHQARQALATAPNPDALYNQIQQSLGDLVGHRLFTLLIRTPGGEVERVWTSDPASYPLRGRKAMGPTPWGAHVLDQAKPWMCNDADGIRWAFPDHALILGLGLGACLSVPVAAFGQTLGTINILDRPGAYDEPALQTALLFAPYLVLPFSQTSSRPYWSEPNTWSPTSQVIRPTKYG